MMMSRGRSTRLASPMWRVDKTAFDGDRQEVAFTTDLPEHNVRLTKTFTLAKHEYHIGLTVRVERLTPSASGKFRYQLAGSHGMPIEGQWYATTFRVAHVGLVDQKDVTYRLTADAMALDARAAATAFAVTTSESSTPRRPCSSSLRRSRWTILVRTTSRFR